MSARNVVRCGSDGQSQTLWFWCPGCDDLHRITVNSPNGWEWDGNEEAPTISPSILVRGVQWSQDVRFYRVGHASVPTGGETVCHSFIRAGRWEFLGDCTHAAAGQTVPMVPLPEWFACDQLSQPASGIPDKAGNE
jgi:hypothetical protein